MQCSIPPVPFTQVAEEAPHTSLQKALPPSPTTQAVLRQAMGVAPASTSTGDPPPSEAVLHCATVPSENSHRLPSVQAGVPQQKTGTDSAMHWPMRQASPGVQSHAVAQEAPTPTRSGAASLGTPKSVTNSGGASPSVHPTISRTNAAATRIIPL